MAEMYHRDKSTKEYKSTPNPTFSSRLLDEIYRSIDGGDEKFGEFKLRKHKVASKQSLKSGGGGGGGGSRGRLKSKSAVEDEETAGFRQACLVEKWMEMKSRRGPSPLPEFDQKLVLDNDPLFFSSGSSSSDSSFGWHSEAETVKQKPKPSCFAPLNRVKTRVSSNEKHNEFDQTDHMRSKTTKIYATKARQPISPGARLTGFINAIFTKDKTQNQKKSKSTNASSCSSASSFSRSCVNRNPSRSTDHGVRATMKFLDSRSYAPKNVCDEQLRKPQTNFKFNEFQMKYNDKKIDFNEDDIASDSSSDLFELEDLAMFENKKYCEELPVYETTHMGTNRAIARDLVC